MIYSVQCDCGKVKNLMTAKGPESAVRHLESKGWRMDDMDPEWTVEIEGQKVLNVGMCPACAAEQDMQDAGRI